MYVLGDEHKCVVCDKPAVDQVMCSNCKEYVCLPDSTVESCSSKNVEQAVPGVICSICQDYLEQQDQVPVAQGIKFKYDDEGDEDEGDECEDDDVDVVEPEDVAVVEPEDLEDPEDVEVVEPDTKTPFTPALLRYSGAWYYDHPGVYGGDGQ